MKGLKNNVPNFYFYLKNQNKHTKTKNDGFKSDFIYFLFIIISQQYDFD